MVLFIKKLLDISLQLSGFDVVIYFGNHGFDKDKAYFTQLLILMGKFHIVTVHKGIQERGDEEITNRVFNG